MEQFVKALTEINNSVNNFVWVTIGLVLLDRYRYSYDLLHKVLSDFASRSLVETHHRERV